MAVNSFVHNSRNMHKGGAPSASYEELRLKRADDQALQVGAASLALAAHLNAQGISTARGQGG
jgi:hypothetical protein